jgi:hypothetical protein
VQRFDFRQIRRQIERVQTLDQRLGTMRELLGLWSFDPLA